MTRRGAGRLALMAVLLGAWGTARAASPVCALPFGPGEHLEYRVDYLGLTAGTVEITVGALAKKGGRDTLPIVATAETRSAFRIYPVHDKFVSELDVLALRTAEDLLLGQEGTRQWQQRMLLDDHKNQLTVDRQTRGRAPDHFTRPLAPGALDVAGMFMAARAQTFAPGTHFELPVTTDMRGFTLVGTVTGRETFASEALGNQSVVRTQLQTGFGGKLSTAKAMEVLYTASPGHVPVWAQASFALGNITAVLTVYQPGSPMTRPCPAPAVVDAQAPTGK